MRRSTFNDDVPLPPHGRAVVVTSTHEYRCSLCGATAASETLASYGQRCGSCYAAFCRAVPNAPVVPDDAVPSGAPEGLRWAYRLRWRHQAGDSLTKVQVDSYTAALRRFDRAAAVKLDDF